MNREIRPLLPDTSLLVPPYWRHDDDDEDIFGLLLNLVLSIYILIIIHIFARRENAMGVCFIVWENMITK